MRRNIGCYVFGRYGCHSINHAGQSHGPPAPRSSSVPYTDNQSQGNPAQQPDSVHRFTLAVPLVDRLTAGRRSAGSEPTALGLRLLWRIIKKTLPML